MATKRRRVTVWEHGDVTCCKCSALTYYHTHCSCEDCDGKAVSRATEYRHWKKARESFILVHNSDTRTTDIDHDVEHVENTCNANDDTGEQSMHSTDVEHCQNTYNDTGEQIIHSESDVLVCESNASTSTSMHMMECESSEPIPEHPSKFFI